MLALKESNLFLRALIVLSLIGFGFFVAIERGLVQLALDADKSYISYLILTIYLIASAHWLYLTRRLAVEREDFVRLEAVLSRSESAGGEVPGRARESLVGALVGNLDATVGGSRAEVLMTAFGDEIANRHALGYFTSDVLLRLGLLGTIVGFIFMLLPIAGMDGFDAGMVQQLLTAMSGGMAVALYTTLAGLVTSTLLKLQYHMLDASAAQLVTRLSVLVDLHFGDRTAVPLAGGAG